VRSMVGAPVMMTHDWPADKAGWMTLPRITLVESESKRVVLDGSHKD